MSSVLGGGAIAPLNDGIATVTRQQSNTVAAVGAGTDLITTVLTALLIPQFTIAWRDLLNLAAAQSDTGFTELELTAIWTVLNVTCTPVAPSILDYPGFSILIRDAVLDGLVWRITPDSTAGDGAPRPGRLMGPKTGGAAIPPVPFGASQPNAVVGVSALLTGSTILLPETVNVGTSLTIYASFTSLD